MKILHYINLTAYLITIGLYVSIIYGIFASLFLGIIQLIIGIILMIQYKKLSKEDYNYLKIYWVLAITSMLSILVVSKINAHLSDFYTIILIQIIPMLIASYFVFITFKIQKEV